jgi:hypothetical protein
VNVGDVITVRTYRGKPDKHSGEERIVATEPETGKIILFDRSEIATKNITADTMVDAELSDERGTFFLARIQRVHSPSESKPELPALEHMMGFYARLMYGTGGYFIPVPEDLVAALRPDIQKGLALRTLRVEVSYII